MSLVFKNRPTLKITWLAWILLEHKSQVFLVHPGPKNKACEEQMWVTSTSVCISFYFYKIIFKF
jgi:hypothetical protein